MTATVHTHSRWKAEATIARLEEQGIRVLRVDPLMGLVLAPMGYGEREVGRVTGEEAALLRSFFDLRFEIDTIDRHIQGGAMKAIGEKIATSDPNTGPFVHMDPKELQPVMTPEETESYYEKRQTAGYLHALLHWLIGSRLNLHSETLGFRGDGIIVSLGKRLPGQ